MQKRVLIPLAVVLLMSTALAGFPSASESRWSPASSAPDILLLPRPVSVARLTSDFAPDERISQLASGAAEHALLQVMSQYPRFLNEDLRHRLARMLVTEGERHRIDPLYLAALIRVESMFRPEAISNKGARGLMQVMPATGEDLARRLDLAWTGAEHLHDPAFNVHLGVAYLGQLLDLYGGNYKFAVTAYNRGPRGVRQIVREHGSLESRFTAYFQKIQSIYRIYLRQLTGPAAAWRQIHPMHTG